MPKEACSMISPPSRVIVSGYTSWMFGWVEYEMEIKGSKVIEALGRLAR